MCGRYALRQDGTELAKIFDLPVALPWRGVGEIFPGDRVPVLRADGDHWRGESFLWGLRPPWARPAMRGQINARLETLAERPFFREALRARRCLVPASAFFEWQSVDGNGDRNGDRNGDGNGDGSSVRSGGAKSRKKRKWQVSLEDGSLFLFAGLWETSSAGLGGGTDGQDGQDRESGEGASLAIVTCGARGALARIHHRSPLILSPARAGDWLAHGDEAALRAQLDVESRSDLHLTAL
ncbi:MAG: SOS response-associated peptidase [Alphaproteobacteria bacterium]